MLIIICLLFVIILIQVFILYKIKTKKVTIHFISEKEKLYEIKKNNNDILISIIEPSKVNSDNKTNINNINQIQTYSKQLNLNYTSKKDVYFYKNNIKGYRDGI